MSTCLDGSFLSGRGSLLSDGLGGSSGFLSGRLFRRETKSVCILRGIEFVTYLLRSSNLLSDSLGCSGGLLGSRLREGENNFVSFQTTRASVRNTSKKYLPSWRRGEPS